MTPNLTKGLLAVWLQKQLDVVIYNNVIIMFTPKEGSPKLINLNLVRIGELLLSHPSLTSENKLKYAVNFLAQKCP